MPITEEEILKEKKILNKTHNLVEKTITELGKDITLNDEELLEFKKLSWKDMSGNDNADIASLSEAFEGEEQIQNKKLDYFKKLKQIEAKPYFASIVFKDEENEIYNIYISLTYLKDKFENNILYDWRSPICSLFYDYEIGEAEYSAPAGTIKGELKRKRQYKIENNKLLGVFDNSLNIDDEFLQSVLAEESSDHMKNVVNTIQQEQNQVIRNLDDNNLIVNGIAGSGKTTVALHRIAFLLYRLKRLSSNNILIFSPNNIFTEYISEVLPSLGEANTLQTTFDDYLSYTIDKRVETYTEFVERFYSGKELNKELVEYKQSDQIIKDIDLFIDDYVNKAEFNKDIRESIINKVTKEELNNYLKDRYIKFPLYSRLDEIAEKLSSNFYKGSNKKVKTFNKLLKDSCNFYKPIDEIYKEFFKSTYSKIKLTDNELKNVFNDEVNYEDALIYAYIKGLLEEKISDLLEGSTKYIELLKTYRSSPEIIAYTNKILKLDHVSAIRKDNNKPVVVRKEIDLKASLIDDITSLQDEYTSIAVITKDTEECEKLYELLNETFNISKIDIDTKTFNKRLIVIPAYLAKGLEFDAVIVYNNRENTYKKNERNLLYVACTRAQHELFIYN